MGLAMNLRVAEETVRYVRQQLPRGAGNWFNGPRSTLRQTEAQACVDHVRRSMPQMCYNFVPQLATLARRYGCGNCGEMAAVAYMYLLQRGCRPLDYMDLYVTPRTRPGAAGHPRPVAIHSFVVIGFAGDADVARCGWGADAVICDPWDGGAYAASRIGLMMRLWRTGCTVRSVFRQD